MAAHESSATPGDHALAARVATDAGKLLVSLRNEMVQDGAHYWQLMDEGDIRAHRFIVGELARERPQDAVLSEEGRDGPSRLTAERVWIVDPLDGTNEYGEPQRHDWAVHVALVMDGSPVAGAVALPAVGVTLSTGNPPPPPVANAGRPLRIVTSRTRPPYAAMVVASAIGAELVPLGSAGAKAMAVVLGEVDMYLHAGGQYEWDSCAPVAVATAVGLHTSRLDGSPLVYNRPDPWLPDLIICRQELAEPALDALWK
jgi:3'(2'), 5'-bisphosphate nucleotidase